MHQSYIDMQNESAVRPAKRNRKPRTEPIQTTRKDGIQTRASMLAELLEHQNNARYNAAPQMPTHPAHYSMTDQRNMVNHSNQVLYPNMMHVPTTIPCSVPQQRSQSAVTTNNMYQQSVGSQTNTRRAVHNLPFSTAPPITSYWNTPRPPISVQNQRAQQMNTQAPVDRPLPKQTKDSDTQTEFTLDDTELEFIKYIRSEGMNISYIKNVLKNSETSLKNNEKDSEKEGVGGKGRDDNENEMPVRNYTVEKIVDYSNNRKSQLLNYVAYRVQMQKLIAFGMNQRTPFENFAANHILNTSRAIQFHNMMSVNYETASQASRPCFLQNEQHQNETINIPHSNLVQNGIMCPSDPVNSRTPPQQQVPQPPLATPPVITPARFMHNYNNFNPNRNGHSQGGARSPQVPNMQLLPHPSLYLNTDFNQHEMPDFFNPHFIHTRS